MKFFKIITSIFIIAILITIGLVIYRYTQNNHPLGDSSGAVLINSSPDPDNPYIQLYDLLDIGEINTDEFDISPIPRSNNVNVTIHEPKDQNLEVFKQWLRENNFDNIPQEKFLFN